MRFGLHLLKIWTRYEAKACLTQTALSVELGTVVITACDPGATKAIVINAFISFNSSPIAKAAHLTF